MATTLATIYSRNTSDLTCKGAVQIVKLHVQRGIDWKLLDHDRRVGDMRVTVSDVAMNGRKFCRDLVSDIANNTWVAIGQITFIHSLIGQPPPL